MTQAPKQLRSSMMTRLRAGLPLTDEDSTSWVESPYSIQQLVALVQREVDRVRGTDSNVLVFRIRHRPFGLVGDDDQQFGEIRAELDAVLRSVHDGIRAVGSRAGEVVGFVPDLRRRGDGEQFLGEILRRLSEPIEVDGLRVLLGPRGGGAVLDDHSGTVEEMLSGTKLALAETGASQAVVMFHPHQRESRNRLEVLAAELHQAVVSRTLSTRYQPDVDLITGRIVAIKAYAHWQPPSGTVVLNRDLFDAAERASLLVPIGREVIEEALRTVYSWITSGLIMRTTVWVNVHPEEVLAPDFEAAMSTVATFDDRLRLGLELTENPVTDQDHIYRILRSLVDKGATAAIGGFGTGHLNLAEFKDLPFSAAKIDRTLTRQITGHGASAQLVGVVTGLAQLFGLDVTAHGVENEDQVRRLKEIGCATGQGFYFARPMSAEDMQELLTQVRMGRKAFP